MKSRKSNSAYPSVSDLSNQTKLEFDNAGIGVEPIEVSSEKEANVFIKELTEKIDESQEWDTQVAAINKGMSLVKGGALNYNSFHNGVFNLYDGLVSAATNLRSALLKQSCLFISQLSREMGPSFIKFGDFFGPLSGLLGHGTQLIADSCKFALLSISRNVPKKKILKSVFDLAKSRGAVQRSVAAECIAIIVSVWPSDIISKNGVQINENIMKLLKDALPETRVMAREAVRKLKTTNEELADNILSKLDERTKRTIENGEEAIPKYESTIKPAIRKRKASEIPVKRMSIHSQIGERNQMKHETPKKKVDSFRQPTQSSSLYGSTIKPRRSASVSSYRKQNKEEVNSGFKREPIRSTNRTPTNANKSNELKQNKRRETYQVSNEEKIRENKNREKLNRFNDLTVTNNRIDSERKRVESARPVKRRESVQNIRRRESFQDEPRYEKIQETRQCQSARKPRRSESVRETKPRTVSKPKMIEREEEKSKFEFNGDEKEFLNTIKTTLASGNASEMQDEMPSIAPNVLRCCMSSNQITSKLALNVLSDLLHPFSTIFTPALTKLITMLLRIADGPIIGTAKLSKSILNELPSLFDPNDLVESISEQTISRNLLSVAASVSSNTALSENRICVKLLNISFKATNSSEAKERNFAGIILQNIFKKNKQTFDVFTKTLSPKEKLSFESFVQNYIPEINSGSKVPKYDENNHRQWIKEMEDLCKSIKSSQEWEELCCDVFTELGNCFEVKPGSKKALHLAQKLVDDHRAVGFQKLLPSLLHLPETKIRDAIISSVASFADPQDLITCLSSLIDDNDKDISSIALDVLVKFISCADDEDIECSSNSIGRCLTRSIGSTHPIIRKKSVLCFVEFKVRNDNLAEMHISLLTLPQQKLIGIYYTKRCEKMK